MTAALCTAFFLSGAAALLFETLWFRHAGLALGNSVWASSAVLASFMAGLALGNSLAARHADRARSPLRLYAALETLVAALGLLIVLSLPSITGTLAPLLRAFGEDGIFLALLRIGVAFGLLVLPASAMGATLPLLASALCRLDTRFSLALGLLYGWNTLGAVLGTLAGEITLIPVLGLRGTATVAALLNIGAALIALALERRLSPPWPASSGGPAGAVFSGSAHRGPMTRLLAAAALSGAALLGLEVVWLRFLQLFVFGTQTAFALMLGTILTGIALGGLAAAGWLHRREAAAILPVLPLAAGFLTLAAYFSLDPARLGDISESQSLPHTLVLSIALVLPTAFASGALFTVTGAVLRSHTHGDARAAGWLTLANTAGAAFGAPLAGLLLLPALGVERSLYALALSYLPNALLLLPSARGARRTPFIAAAALFGLAALAFPFGLMYGRFLKHTIRPYAGPSSSVIAVRESATETALLVQERWYGAAYGERLITNAHSMTGTGFYARRYMKLFAYWPLALRPDARRALLISYGLGNTAEALTRAPGLQRIDVVDTSRAILGLSPLVRRDGWTDPLSDPRVTLHVDDGRFHLLSTSGRYDVITAEPPPPHAAGIVNLYTAEYFRLVRARLDAGGIVTHWLPVNQLWLSDARSIVSAFCSVFEDCSLWTGAGYDWILAGSNGGGAPGTGDPRHLWREPRTRADLESVGIEAPEQVAALFLADSDTLRSWSAAGLPLLDDRPGRLRQDSPAPSEMAAFRSLARRSDAAAFFASPSMRRLWPPMARSDVERAFARQRVFDEDFENPTRPDALSQFLDILTAADGSRALLLLMMDTDPRLVAIARATNRNDDPILMYHRAAAALSDRNYLVAADLFGRAGTDLVGLHSPVLLRALALHLAGERAEARLALSSLAPDRLPEHLRAWHATLQVRLAETGDAPAYLQSAVP